MGGTPSLPPGSGVWAPPDEVDNTLRGAGPTGLAQGGHAFTWARCGSQGGFDGGGNLERHGGGEGRGGVCAREPGGLRPGWRMKREILGCSWLSGSRDGWVGGWMDGGCGLFL